MNIDSTRLLRSDGNYYKNLGSLTVQGHLKANPSYSSNPNTGLEKDTFEINSSGKNGAKIVELKDAYKAAKNEQGVIGKVVDGFKNLFGTKNSSKNIEKAINNLNQNSTEEEIQAVEDMIGKYSSNQDNAVKGVASTGSMMAGGAVGAKFGATIGTAICPGLGTAGGFICGLVIGAIAGAVTNIGINQVENMTDKVKGNSWFKDKNLLKEAGAGALSGGSAVLMGGITQKVTGKIASKIGLTAVKNGGKTAAVALASDGTAKVGSTVAKNALASAIGSGTAATVVADGQYLLDCALDKNKKFSLADLGSTTASSFTLGGLMGGISGGIQGYKGATSYNLHQAEIKAEVQARLLKEQQELEAMARNDQAIKEMQYPSSTSEELKAHPEFQNEHGGYSAEESARFFEAQGKTDFEMRLDEQQAAAQMRNAVQGAQNAEIPAISPTGHKISETSLRAGTSYLAQEGTPEYNALYRTVKDNFVVVRSKEEAMDIFRRQFANSKIQCDEIFVLNPSDPVKVAKKINTSNSYMCDWFAEANGLEGRVVDVNTIQNAISSCPGKKITIFVPDDCAISGSSLILNTTKTLNGLTIPEGTTVQLIYSPMVQSSTAGQAFSALSSFDVEALKGLKVLSSTHNDYEIMESFIKQYGGRINISVAPGGIQTTPFYQTDYFINLRQQNPEVAQAVEAIITNNGSLTGFGRPGQSGVMIAVPTADGVTLKCPNNNPFGSAPYALAEGATPTTIKSPNGKNIAKWQTRLQKILDAIRRPNSA